MPAHPGRLSQARGVLTDDDVRAEDLGRYQASDAEAG